MLPSTMLYRHNPLKISGWRCALSGTLQNKREPHNDAAADDVVPEEPHLRGEEEYHDSRLCHDCSNEYGRCGHPPQEECHHEQSEERSIEDRAHNVHGLDQVLNQRGEGSKTDGNRPPQHSTELRCEEVVPVRGGAAPE